MKSFLNFVRKNGLYAFINLFGLTVSLAFVLLLAVFVSRQLTLSAVRTISRSTFWTISRRWRRLPRISRPPVCPASES